MNNAQRPAFGKGVRLRNETDGTAMLLIPEGALVLNAAAAAALSLVDGSRTVDDIIAELTVRFDVSHDQAREDVDSLFERLQARRLLVTV